MKPGLMMMTAAVCVFVFSGCYTELATRETEDRDQSYASDTSTEAGNTTINNHYYLDDDYRRSRLRVSFNYYYPTYTSWISAYYHSYFDNYYWGMYHRPSWYYDPFYSSYGWCYAPPPYWDPWYPYPYPYPVYYPPVVYYPVYYPSPVYNDRPVTTDRPRTDGPTRDPIPGRDRPTAGNPPSVPSTGPITVGRTGTWVPEGPKPPEGRRDTEKPWWEKVSETKTTRVAEGEERPAPPPATPGETRRILPAERPVNNQPVRDQPRYVPPKKAERQDETAPERPKREEPRFTPPVKKNVPKEEPKSEERPRQPRQQHVSPPPQQQSPPAQSAPRSSGNSGSTSGNSGRRGE